jgi:hypothetical protein
MFIFGSAISGGRVDMEALLSRAELLTIFTFWGTTCSSMMLF